MRNSKLILVSFILMIFIFSCSDDFFDKSPPGTLSDEVFANEDGINALLLGSYGLLTTSDQGGCITNYIMGSMASDEACKGSEEMDGAHLNPQVQWIVPTDHRSSMEKWRWAFDGINKTNQVLRLVNRTEDLSSAFEDRVRGEARFLRALYTFEAWLWFKNIPIITEETEDPSRVTNINPEGAVLAQIISDLEFAWTHLPASQAEVGRPTRYAAMALAAKAYLQEVDYASAKPLLDNIITSGRYEFMPNFMDNYRIETNNNAESIFEIQYTVDGWGGNAGPGRRWSFPHGALGLAPGFHQATQNLVNKFRVDENGLPMFDTFDEDDLKHDHRVASSAQFVPFEDEVDPRLDWTVSRRGVPLMDWGINRGFDFIRDQVFAGPYLPAGPKFLHQRKYHGTEETIPGLNHRLSTKNFRYLRYTHVLLWRAEIAAYEGELDLAHELVNKVRERAGNEVLMGRVLIYELPGSVWPWGEGTTHDDYMNPDVTAVDWTQPAANYNIGLYPPFTDNAEAMRAVQWEIHLEFAMEGSRFFDLRRWEKLPGDLKVNMAETLNRFAEVDCRNRHFMCGATFPERAKYQPIPQVEIDLAPDYLVQNPGY